MSRKLWSWLSASIATAVSVLIFVRFTGLLSISPLTQLIAFPQIVWSALIVGSVCSVLGRRFKWWFAALALLAAWPLLPNSPTPSRTSPEFTVMTSNVLRGRGTAAALDIAKARTVDVLFLVECDSQCARLIQSDNVKSVYPYQVVAPGQNANGAAIISRYPLAPAAADLTTTGFSLSAAAVLQLPGAQPTLLKLAHPHPPLPTMEFEWRNDLAQLAAIGESTKELQMVMAGDFNATAEHREFRDILFDGAMTDVATALGVQTGTWPSRWPEWLGSNIDHILARDFETVSIETVSVLGSDHRALIAVLRPSVS